MAEMLAGFDWDAGNRAKCQKHGVSVADIEALFSLPLLIILDAVHSKTETRIRALGKTGARRMVFSRVHGAAERSAAPDSPNQRALHACQRGCFL